MDNLNALIIIVPESEVNEVDVQNALEYLEIHVDDYFVVCSLFGPRFGGGRTFQPTVHGQIFGELSDAMFSRLTSGSWLCATRERSSQRGTFRGPRSELSEYLAARNIQYVDIIGFDPDECDLAIDAMKESGYKATIVPVRSSSTNTASLILPPDLEKVANDLLYSNIRERPTAE